MLNSISIHGRLVRDPELRTTQSGVSVCAITVAVDRSYAKQGEEKQTDFIDVVCWKNTADIVSRYFVRGKEIIVNGSLQSRKWKDKNGNDRITWEIQANSVDFCGGKGDSSGTASSGTAQSSTAVDDPAALPPEEDLPF